MISKDLENIVQEYNEVVGGYIWDEVMEERATKKRKHVIGQINNRLDDVHNARKDLYPESIGLTSDIEATVLYQRLLNLKQQCKDNDQFKNINLSEIESLKIKL